MAGEQRAYGTAGGPEACHDTEEGAMRMDAEPFGNKRRDGGKETSMSQTVKDAKEIEHPKPMGELQPHESSQQQEKTRFHHRFAAARIDDQTADETPQHAHRADGREDAGGLNGGDA